MVSALRSDALQMFFNDDFSPAAYVDALHASLTANANPYSPQTLAAVSSKSHDLIAHLDYNVNEVLRELARKMDHLKKLSGTIGALEFSQTSYPELSDSTRLQYYVDALRHAVEMLKANVDSVKRESSPNVLRDGDPVDSLIRMKAVKANILAVRSLLVDVQLKTGLLAPAISDTQFQITMLSLHESLRARLRDEPDAVADIVKQLRSWVPLFQPFTKFGPTFVKHVAKLETELAG